MSSTPNASKISLATIVVPEAEWRPRASPLSSEAFAEAVSDYRRYSPPGYDSDFSPPSYRQQKQSSGAKHWKPSSLDETSSWDGKPSHSFTFHPSSSDDSSVDWAGIGRFGATMLLIGAVATTPVLIVNNTKHSSSKRR